MLLKSFFLFLKYSLFALLVCLCVSCAPRQVGKINPSSTQGLDPYQPFNRAMYKFNGGLTKVILQPVVTVYTVVLPSPVRTGVSNFFSNIWMVPTILNDILQLNFPFVAKDTARFVINTTLGVGGLFDVASGAGFHEHPQGFGLTLARWGVVRSPYLVLPFFGPTTFRDALGMVPDYYASPITYVKPWQVNLGLRSLGFVDAAASVIPQQKLLTVMALDPYVAVRNAYLQNRAHVVDMIRGDKNSKDKDKQNNSAPMLSDANTINSEKPDYSLR